MGKISPFKPVLLFCGILYSNTQELDRCLHLLSEKYGPISHQSNQFDYTHSTYYAPEMGSELKKIFVVFSTLINPEVLPDIKIYTNTIEDDMSSNGKRHINLDPGTLSLHQLILLSTKNYAHRIPLQKGIYAELTLFYSKKKFQELPWTYPDFKFKEYHAFFLDIRKAYYDALL